MMKVSSSIKSNNGEVVGHMTPTKKTKLKENWNKIKEKEDAKNKEDLEFFDYEYEDKKEELTNDEKMMYGNREPKDYKKIKLLGK